jgi:hypothetical protein
VPIAIADVPVSHHVKTPVNEINAAPRASNHGTAVGTVPTKGRTLIVSVK